MLQYLQIGISVLIGLLSALAPLRDNGKLTAFGRLLLLAAVISFVVAVLQERHSRETREMERHGFDLASSIQLTLEAEYYAPEVDDSVVLANAPAEFAIRSAELGDHMIDFEFVGVRDIWRPSRSRVIPPARLLYIARHFRLNDLNPKLLPFQYVWQLNDRTLKFRVPLHKFRRFIGQREWLLKVTLLLGGQVLAFTLN